MPSYAWAVCTLCSDRPTLYMAISDADKPAVFAMRVYRPWGLDTDVPIAVCERVCVYVCVCMSVRVCVVRVSVCV